MRFTHQQLVLVRRYWIKDRSYSARRIGFHNVVEKAIVAFHAAEPVIYHPAAAVPDAVPPSNVLFFDSVAPADKLQIESEIEKCEKPIPLLRYLMRLFLQAGQRGTVVDLCAGSAPIVSAAVAEGHDVIIYDKRQQFCLSAAAARVRDVDEPKELLR